MRLKELISEKLNRTGSNELVIFDIDDTLLHTTAKINVVKNGKVTRSLTNQEFNNYKLQPGEEFDFGEFRDARKFEEESVPIGPMLDKLRSDLASGKNVVMLTARADFDNQKAVWRTFKRHGIDINRDVHLYRAGNQPGNESPAVKKAIHVNQWLKTGKYDRVVMYDDSEKNLAVFKSLEERFPEVKFEAHHVSEKGDTRQIEDVEQDPGTPIPFPKGTTVVDVSDPYDWYKLGMVISDLDDANPEIFGKGAPSTVLAFGSEEEEHRLLPHLKRLGLKLHDIDKPSDIKKAIPAKSLIDKLDQKLEEARRKKKKIKQAAYGPGPYGLYGFYPGYSGDGGGEGIDGGVGENFADGRNPQDKGDSKRYGVPTKASISTLRKVAKQGGRKGQLAHWMANMKAGRAKKK